MMNITRKHGLFAVCALFVSLAFVPAADAAERRAAGFRQGSTQPETTHNQEEQKSAIDFSRMMREVEALRRFAGTEADNALTDLAKDRQALHTAVGKLRVDRASLEKNVIAMQERYNAQIERLKELETIEKEDINSRKALEGAVRLTAGAARDRLAVSAYASASPEMVDTAVRIAGATSFPSFNDIKAVADLLFSELRHTDAVTITPDTLTLPDGRSSQARILRVGGLLAAARLEDGRHVFAQPVDGGRRLLEIRTDIPSSATKLVEQAFADGATAFPVDFSEGAVFKRFTGQKGFAEHVLAGGPLIWPIIGLGLIALAFGLAKYAKLLRVRFGSPRVLDEFFTLVRGGCLEKAREMLNGVASRNIPVYSVLRHMLAEWREGNIASMEKCRDEAILAHTVPLERGVPFVAIIAAVAPLLGLLGTVTGMIGTFDVITIFGNSDPKLLSGGISVALVTTELGLVTAIPLMFLHFALSRRVARLADDMEEKGAVLIARASAGGTG